MELLYLPFVVLIAVPPLAFAPAALLAACMRRHDATMTGGDRTWAAVGGVSWLAYAVYECGVWWWSQGVVAPIRVDLLLIAPLLYALSFLALRACWKARRRAGQSPAEADRLA